jgi:putative transposase
LIRNTFRYASRKYWGRSATVYTAATEAEARAGFVEFADKWGRPYPAIRTLWENAWAEFVPFLDYRARSPRSFWEWCRFGPAT